MTVKPKLSGFFLIKSSVNWWSKCSSVGSCRVVFFVREARSIFRSLVNFSRSPPLENPFPLRLLVLDSLLILIEVYAWDQQLKHQDEERKCQPIGYNDKETLEVDQSHGRPSWFWHHHRVRQEIPGSRYDLSLAHNLGDDFLQRSRNSSFECALNPIFHRLNN